MKTLQNYTGLPTVTDGSLKKGVWLTALHNDLVDGTIKVDSSTLPESIEIIVDGKEYKPKVLALLAASFERCYGAKATSTVSDIVKLAEAGFITPQQQAVSLAGVREAKTSDTFASSKIVLTAKQYLHNCAKLGLSESNLETIIDLALQVHALSEKSTKAELLSLLDNFASVFISPDQLGTYNVKLADEEAARVKFERLTSAGFTNINTMASGRYVGTLDVTSLSAIATLQPDFVLVGTNSTDGANYTVTFKDVDLDK